MIDFNELSLRRKLNTLSKSKQLAFMLLLCERMMPGFDSFAIEEVFDNSFYRECLDNAWSQLAGTTSLANCRKLAQACLDGAPDTEEFENPLVSAALNAALAVGLLMSFFSDYKIEHAVEAAGLARDTAALYAQRVAAISPRSLGYDEVTEHPLVQKELQRQEEDLVFLASLQTDPKEVVPTIKERASRPS